MATCYKCGAEVPGPNPECDDCANGTSREEIERHIGEALSKGDLREIDWDKAKTVEDFRLILKHTFWHIAIPTAHPAYELLKRFLKD